MGIEEEPELEEEFWDEECDDYDPYDFYEPDNYFSPYEADVMAERYIDSIYRNHPWV